MSSHDPRPAVHVSLSHYHPHPGMAHAGGEYVCRHLAAMSRERTVTAFVSADRPGEHSLADPVVDTVVIDRPRWGRTLVVRALRLAGRRWNPSSVGFDVRWSFSRSPELRHAIRHADTVEFQFFEQCWAIGMARRWNPSARTVAVVHDVVSQRLERQLDELSPRGVRRYALMLRLGAFRRRERKLLSRFDAVTVFSEKDRQLLVDGGVGTEIYVLRIPLADESVGQRAPQAGNVLFVGAFDRIENSEAALWLLDEIWPRVHAQFPNASLTLAGANPTAAMSTAALRRSEVEITGYVPDLAELYRRASIVVVPLRQGAGVKFKTVMALLWGVPMVSTSVGVEGVPMPEPFALVADDAEEFADLVGVALAGEWDRAAEMGRAWAASHYSQEAFESDLAAAMGMG